MTVPLRSRLALGFTTRRRVRRVGPANLDPTVFRLYQIFSSLTLPDWFNGLTDVGSGFNPTCARLGPDVELVGSYLNQTCAQV